jgi:hypothetical protein
MKANLPVLIDKPVVGSVRDCDRLMDLEAKHGTLVYGGSSLRFAREVTALRETVGGGLISLTASGPGDFFAYGIHTTEMLQGCAGIGIRTVKAVAENTRPVLAVTYKEGLVAFLHLQMPFYEWSLCAHTDHGLRTATVDPDRLYEPFLRNFIALLKGESVDYTLAGPVEAVRVQIAAKISLAGGGTVMPDDLPAFEGFDGGAFAAEYAATKGENPAAKR